MNMIKTVFILILPIILLFSCTSEKYLVEVEPSGTRIIKGIFVRSDLEHDSTFTWCKTNYETYVVDPATSHELAALSDDIHFVIVLGTWCGDSKREVPQLLKIFDSAKISEHKIVMIGVDRLKKSQNSLSDKYNIQRVPTLIVMKGDIELGRIVENPKETLERDILRIVQKK